MCTRVIDCCAFIAFTSNVGRYDPLISLISMLNASTLQSSVSRGQRLYFSDHYEEGNNSNFDECVLIIQVRRCPRGSSLVSPS